MSMSYALHFYKDNLKVRELRDLPKVAWAKQCGVSQLVSIFIHLHQPLVLELGAEISSSLTLLLYP